MKTNRWRRWGVVGGCALSLGLAAVAGGADEPAAAEKSAAEKAEHGPDMAAMAALATPGPEHAALAALEGDFTADVTSMMIPDKPAEKSTGTQKNRMILGGRFLHGEYDGQMMSTPFQGIGLTGYDNHKKKVISFWVDSMTTAWMTSEGTVDEAHKVWTLSGTFDCPMTGKPETLRQVMTIIDSDTYTFEMHGPGPDGKEFKMMEIKYTRAK